MTRGVFYQTKLHFDNVIIFFLSAYCDYRLLKNAFNILESLLDRQLACSASDRQSLNL